METEERFEELGEKLEKISDKQDEHIREIRREHERVNSKVSYIVELLDKDEAVDIEKSDFESKS